MQKNLIKSMGQVLILLENGKIDGVSALQKIREMQKKTAPDINDVFNLEKNLQELQGLIGLENIKTLVYEIQAFIQIQQKRKIARLQTEPLVLHMIFSGAPGTGKTTVARLLGKIFKEMGILEKGHLLEVERADLVGEYIGHTASKTREQIKQALGGILFIDEAYALARGGEKDFGKEAIDTLVKAMEDQRENFILILAGYEAEMEYFLQTNPGLKSRFPLHLKFPDYSINELTAIAKQMLQKREYRFSESAEKTLAEFLQNNLNSSSLKSGNARMIRNLVEKSIRKQAVRLVKQKKFSREELILIEDDDIKEELSAYNLSKTDCVGRKEQESYC